MIRKSLTLSFAAVALMAAPLRAADEKSCTDLAAETTKSVTAAPENVVKIVSELTAKNPACACDIVGAALVASKADASLRTEIVNAALEAAPDQLEAITACTKTPDPSGKEPVGKEPAGKEPTGKQPKGTTPVEPVVEAGNMLDTIDFGLFRAGIGGVYIGSPSGGTGTTTVVEVPEETTTPQEPRRVIVRIPGTVSPVAAVPDKA